MEWAMQMREIALSEKAFISSLPIAILSKNK